MVKALIRNTAFFPKDLAENRKIKIIDGNITDLSVHQITELINDCDAIISCLGHNITLKGLFGKPRKLVFTAVKKVEESIRLSQKKCKFILMSTTAYTNKKEGEQNTFGERIVFTILKALLPHHSDNIAAGDFLLYHIKKVESIEWVLVRPDSLIDESTTSEVVIVDKKLRSPIFDPGKTSRINVAQFISDLLTNDSLWKEWRYKTPVIYNKIT